MIFFLTDWGNSYYVGVAKGVMNSISPESKIIDISHSIDPFDIEEAAHIIERVFRDLPKGSTLLCVVDPGVGSERKALALEIDGKFLVAPDNGVLTRLLDLSLKARSIENPKYMYKYPPSKTFHGRDIFAPAAAYIEKGVKIEEFGPAVDTFQKIEIKRPCVSFGKIEAYVSYVDSFGNLETIVSMKDFLDAGISGKYVLLNGKRAIFTDNYAEGKREFILVHVDSSGYLEISSSAGRASDILGLKKRDRITFENFD
ncbi:SAM hydrolase/SAM-dependent halogenase family protein [Athalassotoga saccharophila]|uniref:SAM hydrolase/SAM-dependent halogenase family protein n=1 Tax=Athalassotoga saccharophila TaxID=1441386 RepID=UPI0013794608|nr:SAM-dependent chlorinase/fluorinase [Athalassotoga saccharophila]BBJ27710.1 5'-fluoro-5'-deoxy-adenosine synthase [Athalassotoga saccharophila]